MIIKKVHKSSEDCDSPKRKFRKTKLFKICTWSFIIILVIVQIKLALYQTKHNFSNMTDMQKGVAKSVLGDEEYAKIASAETDALESKFLNQTVSRGDTRPILTPQPTVNPTSTSVIILPDAGESNTSVESKEKIAVSKKIMDAITDTAKMVDLDIRLAKTLVHTESGYVSNCICSNGGYRDRKGTLHEGSVDYGLTQVNNRGGVIGDFLGKKIDLADGRKQVEVTNSNYRTDMYVNLFIGLASYKHYLVDLSNNNPFIAYACYNAGEGSYTVFNGMNTGKFNGNDVANILEDTGKPAFIQASKNVRNNFAMKYKLYFN